MNAIEYRFAGSKDIVIANNITDAPIAARNGAKAELYGNFTKASASMFVDAAGCDLRLKQSFGAIVGRAAPLRAPIKPADCAVDFEGHARRTDGPGDIGADQFGSSPADLAAKPDRAGPSARAGRAGGVKPPADRAAAGEEKPKVDPKAAELYRAARSAERSGMKEIAKLLYERLVKEHPESPLIGKAKKALAKLGG